MGRFRGRAADGGPQLRGAEGPAVGGGPLPTGGIGEPRMAAQDPSCEGEASRGWRPTALSWRPAPELLEAVAVCTQV